MSVTKWNCHISTQWIRWQREYSYKKQNTNNARAFTAHVVYTEFFRHYADHMVANWIGWLEPKRNNKRVSIYFIQSSSARLEFDFTDLKTKMTSVKANRLAQKKTDHRDTITSMQFACRSKSNYSISVQGVIINTNFEIILHVAAVASVVSFPLSHRHAHSQPLATRIVQNDVRKTRMRQESTHTYYLSLVLQFIFLLSSSVVVVVVVAAAVVIFTCVPYLLSALCACWIHSSASILLLCRWVCLCLCSGVCACVTKRLCVFH